MEDFFALIQLGIGSREKLGRVLNDRQWQQVVELAERQALLGVLFAAMERLLPEERPRSEVILTMYAKQQLIEKMSRQSLEKTVEVQAMMKARGWRSCVLKGVSMSALYPRWELRQTGDIDIWVDAPRDEVVKMCREYSDKVRPVFHNAPLRVFDHPAVEAHFAPNWMYWPGSHVRMQRWFEKEKETQMVNRVEIDGRSFVAPTMAFDRVFVLSHIYRHLFGEGIGLRQLLDYYFVLHEGFTEEERRETMRVLGRLKMKRFAGAVMWVMREVFGLEERFLLTEPDEKEGRFLLSEVIKAGNLGAYSERSWETSKSAMGRFVGHVRRNVRFLTHYPWETVGTPLFKIWHFCWRKAKGYC